MTSGLIFAGGFAMLPVITSWSMEPPAYKKRRRLPPEAHKTALVTLLADEDPLVYTTVRKEILSYGQSACAWLQPYTLSSDPVIRRRTSEIIRFLASQDCDERFLSFCQHSGEDLDLELATGLLAQTEFPDINLEGYQALFDAWAGELKTRIDFADNPEKILNTVNHFFFNELGFVGHEQYGSLPECSYLNCVVDRRAGNPISLCTVYLFLARRLCLPMTGIGLPSHFICRYQTSTTEIYLDAYRSGQFLSRADCVRFLLETCHGVNQGFLSPVSSRRTLSRMCANLHQTYSQLELPEKAGRIQRYLIALAR